jgi:cobalt-zinc-cadmium efflux system outer membrane protein
VHVAPGPPPSLPPRESIQPAAVLGSPEETVEEFDLPRLWRLARQHHPELREAAADVDVARGQRLQARVYPNPRFVGSEDAIGSRIAREGNFTVQLTQEFVTAGKRKLDIAVAEREIDVSALALVGKQFEILTRLRRAYYDVVSLGRAAQVQDETVATLEAGIAATRELVEKTKTRPQTDLLALQALLGEAKINRARTQAQRQAAWKVLAAETGMPDLPAPAVLATHVLPGPDGDIDTLTREVLARHTQLLQARAEVERSRFAWERARAEAIPNVIVGGGYTAPNLERTAGAVVSLEFPVPVWDRKRGLVYQAEARYAKAQAAVRSTETRLRRDVADAWARYEGTRQQVERLQNDVLPRLRQRLELLRKGFQAGAAQVSFSDLLMTEQGLLASRLALTDAQRAQAQALADLQGLLQVDDDVQ